MNCPIKDIQVIVCNSSCFVRVGVLYEDDIVYTPYCTSDRKFWKELIKSLKSMTQQKQYKGINYTVCDIDENTALQHGFNSLDIERVVFPLNMKYENIETGEIIDELEIFVPVVHFTEILGGKPVTITEYPQDPCTIVYRILETAYRPFTATALRG